MSRLQTVVRVLREARRRWAVQRALARGECVDGVGLLGSGLDAVLMRTSASLQNVDPVDRLLRYVNGAAARPPRITHTQAVIRQELGSRLHKAWRERRYPNLVINRRLGHMAKGGAR